MSVSVPAWQALASVLLALTGVALTWAATPRPWPRLLALLAGLALAALLCDLRIGEAPGALIVRTPGAGPGPGLRWPAVPPAGFSSLRELPPERIASGLQVTGHGLPASLWAESDAPIRRFTPPSLPEGFLDVRWPDTITVGATVEVRGRVRGPATRVTLELDGARLDEGAVDSEGRFRLRFRAPAAGRLLLGLSGRDPDGAVRFQETLGLAVETPPSAVIRIELSRPGFDFRALRDWLLDAGATVEFSTELAPGVVRRELSGARDDRRPAPPDLWITDGRWAGTGDRVASLLEAARGGAGVLVFLRGGPAPEALGFRARPLAQPRPEPLSPGEEALEVQVTHALEANPGERVLLADGAGRPLLLARRVGAGTLALAAFAGGPRWGTGATPAALARHFAPIIAELGRPRPVAWFVHAELLPTVGLRTVVCSPGDERPRIEPAPRWPLLAADGPGDARCVAWWPARPGWHSVAGAPLFVHALESWGAWRARDRQEATRAARLRASPAPRGEPASRQRWWLLLFLASALLLWLEQRRRGHRASPRP